MITRDILLLVSTHCDNDTLEKLSKTVLWNDIRTFASDQYFWKIRVQNLVGMNLNSYLAETTEAGTSCRACWKEVYYILEPVLECGEIFLFLEPNNAVAVKIVLDLGYDPSEDGNDLLIRADEGGYSETVKLLLEHIDPSEGYGDLYPMDVACENGHAEVVKLLLADTRVYLDGYGSLISASRGGYIEVTRLLLSDSRVDSADSGDYDERILQVACEEEHIDIVKLLLSDGRIDPSENDNSCILYASTAGDVELVKLLLEDEKVDPSDQENQTIIEACSRGHLEVVKLLLEDSRVDPSDQGSKAFVESASEGHLEVVKLLLEDKRIDPTEHKNYALSRAIIRGQLEVVRLLIEDLRIHPLGDACSSTAGHVEIIKLLLTHPRIILSREALIFVCRRELNNRRRVAVIDLLLKHKKMNLDELTSEPQYFELLLKLMLPVIREKILGYYPYRDALGIMYTYYRSLLLLLIFRRPSFEEVLEWILIHPNKEMILAARSLISGRIDHSSSLSTSFLGFLLLAIEGYNLETITKQLQREEADSRGISLASGLIGAFLGSKKEVPILNYEQVCKMSR